VRVIIYHAVDLVRVVKGRILVEFLPPSRIKPHSINAFSLPNGWICQ
jgi:hypothetical protein